MALVIVPSTVSTGPSAAVSMPPTTTAFQAPSLALLATEPIRALFDYCSARMGHPAPLTVVGPPGTRALVDRLAAAFGAWVGEPRFPMQVLELPPGEALALGDRVTLAARAVPHTPESVAYSIERDRHRVVYTGDTGWDPALGEWATGCDVLLCECSLPQHLTPEQCGALAAIARPRLLALTHLYPSVLDVDIPAAVRARFAGDVVIAFDGWTHAREEMPCWS